MSTDRLYARVSGRTQDTLSQWPQLRQWRKQNDSDAIEVEDVGTGRTMKRDGIRSIICDVRLGKVKRIIVCSINRLGRNVRQVLEVIDELLVNHCQLISIREKVDISSPMGRCLIQLLACLGELENEQRSEATRAGIAAARERAEKAGKVFRMGGSIKGASVKVTQALGDGIRAAHQAGASYREIARSFPVSDKTARRVCEHPTGRFQTRTEMAKERRHSG